jgi:hypothetical protein
MGAEASQCGRRPGELIAAQNLATFEVQLTARGERKPNALGRDPRVS